MAPRPYFALLFKQGEEAMVGAMGSMCILVFDGPPVRYFTNHFLSARPIDREECQWGCVKLDKYFAGTFLKSAR